MECNSDEVEICAMDLKERRYRLKQVYQADRAMLVELEEKSTQILAQQEGVEQQKNSISLLRQQLMASREQYTEQLQQQAVTTARLKENRGALAAAISRLDQDSDSITELILEKVAAAQAAIAAARAVQGLATSGTATSRRGSYSRAGRFLPLPPRSYHTPNGDRERCDVTGVGCRVPEIDAG